MVLGCHEGEKRGRNELLGKGRNYVQKAKLKKEQLESELFGKREKLV